MRKRFFGNGRVKILNMYINIKVIVRTTNTRSLKF